MNKRDAIQRALEVFSNPKVNYQVLLASTPDVAMDIVETLPGVKEFVEIGPDAADAALSLLRTDGGVDSNNRATIGLYLLHHISTPQTKEALANAVVNNQFKGVNRELAASAFLRSSGLEAEDEDVVGYARDKAREFQNQIGSQTPNQTKTD